MSCGEDNVCSNVYVRCFCYSHKQVHTCQISFFFFFTPHIVLVLIKYVNDVLIAAQFDTACAAVHRKKNQSPSWFIVTDLVPCSKFQNQPVNLFKKTVDVFSSSFFIIGDPNFLIFGLEERLLIIWMLLTGSSELGLVECLPSSV